MLLVPENFRNLFFFTCDLVQIVGHFDMTGNSFCFWRGRIWRTVFAAAKDKERSLGFFWGAKNRHRRFLLDISPWFNLVAEVHSPQFNLVAEVQVVQWFC